MLPIQRKISPYNHYEGNNIRYIVIHYVGATGTAKNNVDYFYGGDRQASAHYFVDEKEVYQSVKDNDTAYHCGSKTYKHKICRNSNSIGIELCSRKDANGKYYFKDEVVNRAVALTIELMKKYNIPVENVIRHYDVTGKVCPAPFVNNDRKWSEFISKLSTGKKLETGNDIVWELMHGKHKIKISEVDRAVKALDKAKANAEFNSLYWIIYKVVNGNG